MLSSSFYFTTLLFLIMFSFLKTVNVLYYAQLTDDLLRIILIKVLARMHFISFFSLSASDTSVC